MKTFKGRSTLKTENIMRNFIQFIILVSWLLVWESLGFWNSMLFAAIMVGTLWLFARVGGSVLPPAEEKPQADLRFSEHRLESCR